MTRLDFVDHRSDPGAWAQELGISKEAVELYLASDVLDLHVDSFIWTRIFGYDLTRRHGHGLLSGVAYSQVDFPRILEAGLTGATWIITTNPSRSAKGRERAFVENLRRLRRIFDGVSEQFSVVRNVREYREARAASKHAAFIGIQGGNALDASPDSLDLIEDDVVLRITLVHLSSSSLGVTSSPLKAGADSGLTDRGRDYVRRLNEKRIFVDLAHISKRGFWDAVEIHDKDKPLIVTHTGVSGVFEHWRNLDDDQLKAVADSGGTIGVMYQSSFLGDPYFGGKAESIARHLGHIVKTVGADHAALGSDWDGAISPPRDMLTCLELPKLVDILLRDGHDPDTIQKILGGSFLRTVELLRG
ncbi:MAG: membrane dipeptidase [Myxococcales bacterium]|nr:membrane dipeptidase [Myxococcales bacterium]MCB9577258.1 membrane dipeptidase [Polyangiaceae bacterium]